MQHKKIVRSAKASQFICILLLTILPSLDFNCLKLLNFNCDKIYISLGTIAFTAFFVEEYIDWMSKASYKSALDILRDALFKNMPPDEMFHHRATLFKANRRETKLKFFCRSGTQYQKKVQPFKINNDNEKENEGIAGQAWFKNATLNYPNLPEWRDDDKYANSGHLPLDKVKKLNVKSRSIVATPIRNLDGKRWGVLVVDSRNPNEFLDKTQQNDLFESIAATIGKLL